MQNIAKLTILLSVITLAVVAILVISDKLKMIKHKRNIKKYERDIKNNNIVFTQNISDKYCIHGIDVEVDFNVCSYNKKYKDYILKNLVYQVNNMISRELSVDILVALKEEKVKFYLRDAQSIQLEKGYGVGGVYYPNDKEIHIGLKPNIKSVRKTFFHEVGHFIDHMASDANMQLMFPNSLHSEFDIDTGELFEDELRNQNLRKYARENRAEFIAVAFENYLSNKQSLNHIPSLKNLLDDYLNRLHLKYFSAIISSDLYITRNSDFSLDDTIEITDEDYLEQVVYNEC